MAGQSLKTEIQAGLFRNRHVFGLWKNFDFPSCTFYLCSHCSNVQIKHFHGDGIGKLRVRVPLRRVLHHLPLATLHWLPVYFWKHIACRESWKWRLSQAEQKLTRNRPSTASKGFTADVRATWTHCLPRWQHITPIYRTGCALLPSERPCLCVI